jgi:hypothetical protein
VLVRTVVRHVIQNDLEPEPVGISHERVEIREAAEPRIDVAVI